MILTARQLAKLRALARTANELELRHEARRAAIQTQRDYLVTLGRKLERLPRERDAKIRTATTPAHHDDVERQFLQDDKRLRDEIAAARAELEQLLEQLSMITQAVAPARELITRILNAANMQAAAAGIDFDDSNQPAGERVATIGGL